MTAGYSPGDPQLQGPALLFCCPVNLKTCLLTAAAMLAFAANSLLCRLALGGGLIDPASFATIRTASGAAALAAILLLRPGKADWRPDWKAGA